MATYAIGDVQGCYDELQALLERIGFDRDRDRLWFVGDLVNRGPKSLQVLRFVRSLEESAVTVLGNHDLHLITQHEGFERKREDDTFTDVLDAPDAKELIVWLRARPLMHVEGDWAMVHAGLLPQWSIDKAAMLASEVEAVLVSARYREFLANMYGSKPGAWSDSLEGWDRLRVIVNAMTRLRFCSPEGVMDFKETGKDAPPGFRPWYQARPGGEERQIVFGHWSSAGLQLKARVAGLDTGCVWGGPLTALRLEDRWLAQVPSPGYQPIKEGR
jgi:bis(5'-nucleosyl)-tetraphosphatase (symmetrical)